MFGLILESSKMFDNSDSWLIVFDIYNILLFLLIFGGFLVDEFISWKMKGFFARLIDVPVRICYD